MREGGGDVEAGMGTAPRESFFKTVTARESETGSVEAWGDWITAVSHTRHTPPGALPVAVIAILLAGQRQWCRVYSAQS